MKNKFNTPTIFIIFGGTGDLSKQKLIPSLFELYCKKYLPTKFKLVGLSKDELTSQQYQNFVRQAILSSKHKHLTKELSNFLKNVSFQTILFNKLDGYYKLTNLLKNLDNKIGQCTNKLFYLAVAPVFFSSILTKLSKLKLTIPCSDKAGWTRILIEKPFATDIHTAQALDRQLGKLFKEGQIFRIDHYLAKETLQNILTFRFSNFIFDPLWNNKYIEKIEIKLWEKNNVSQRGAFYDSIGALRDVGENHMLQMLAMVAMDNPQSLVTTNIRNARAKILKQLILFNKQSIRQHVVRGQYIGFTKEKKVNPHSTTETYFKLKVFLRSQRWQGVPFFLESGKALRESKTEINVYFKEVKPCFCSVDHLKHHHHNLISFKIQPQKKISIRFWVKKFGSLYDIHARDLSFNYQPDSYMELAAYQRVIYDAIIGDQTLFTETAEVTAAWKFITPILKGWHKNKIYRYRKGSLGPNINI